MNESLKFERFYPNRVKINIDPYETLILKLWTFHAFLFFFGIEAMG